MVISAKSETGGFESMHVALLWIPDPEQPQAAAATLPPRNFEYTKMADHDDDLVDYDEEEVRLRTTG
jgi:hypothetical protein